MLHGEGALAEFAKRLGQTSIKKILLVTDKTLVKIGLAQTVTELIEAQNIQTVVFDETHPNPIEEDVEKGARIFTDSACDAVVALGGGSPMDAAKVIMIAATHPGPLDQYDDAIGGDRLIDGNKLPALYAITTTAGTGSEVGRSGVITMRSTNNKTIFFHPQLLPKIAVLDPELTKNLPPFITAATGVDAFTHCLEAYFAKGEHPMADGIAQEGIRLVLGHLSEATHNGSNLNARNQMLIAASMGATAFQKGLGMIHSLAHPLSSECGLHHGLANALVLPACVEFLEKSNLSQEQKQRINRVQNLFKEAGLDQSTLSLSCRAFIESLGIQMGLKNHGVSEDKINLIGEKAFKDVCHQSNMIPVDQKILTQCLRASL